MPRKLSAAKYKNKSLRIEREGAKKLRVAINEWMADVRKAAIKGLNKLNKVEKNSGLFNKLQSAAAAIVIADIQKDLGQQIALELTDWEILEQDGIVKIKPVILEILRQSGQNTTQLFNIKATFDIVNVQAVELAETITSTMVREVTTETQRGIAVAIRDGQQLGQSIPQIAKKIKPRVGLTLKQVQAVANFEERYIIANPTAKRDRIDRAVNRYERKKHRERTEMIARTESSRANAEGALNVYEAEGVTTEWIAVTGNDFDPEFCQDNDGKVFTIAEARGMIPAHPNCECIWGPHVEVAAVAA